MKNDAQDAVFDQIAIEQPALSLCKPFICVNSVDERSWMCLWVLFLSCVKGGVEHESDISRVSSQLQNSVSGAKLASSYSGITYSGTRPFSSVTSTLTLGNCKFNKCYGSQNGGCIYSSSSYTITVTNCEFNYCYAGAKAGCIYSGSSGAVNIQSSTAIGCHSGSTSLAGVLYIYSGQGTIEDSCVFRDCYAYEYGGVVYQSETSSKMIVRDSEFYNCWTSSTAFDSDGGGALSLWKGSFTCEGCLFEYCRSAMIAGAIRLRIVTTATVSECTFRHCRAGKEGGGISVYTDSTSSVITLTKIFCTNCTAGTPTAGQAIHVGAAKSFTWSELCIEDCGDVPVYSTLNQPSLSRCWWVPTNLFTDSVFRRVRMNVFCLSKISRFVITYAMAFTA